MTALLDPSRSCLLAALLVACAPMRPPVVEPFADGEHWMLREPLQYRVPGTGETLMVPAGFVTDFASIPRLLCPALPASGQYLVAAIVHDYLYWEQPCTRADADRLVLVAMREAKVPLATQIAIFAGARVGGRQAWEDNARQRAEGRPQLVPAGFQRVPVETPWLEYQRELYSRGVRVGPRTLVRPSFCQTPN